MRKKAKISMVARESADEAFSRFLLTKRANGLNSPKIIQRYLKSSKIKQILRKLAKTA